MLLRRGDGICQMTTSAGSVVIRMIAPVRSASFQETNVRCVSYPPALSRFSWLLVTNTEAVLGECNHSFHMVCSANIFPSIFANEYTALYLLVAATGELAGEVSHVSTTYVYPLQYRVTN
jgi:hypothetical protein